MATILFVWEFNMNSHSDYSMTEINAFPDSNEFSFQFIFTCLIILIVKANCLHRGYSNASKS